MTSIESIEVLQLLSDPGELYNGLVAIWAALLEPAPPLRELAGDSRLPQFGVKVNWKNGNGCNNALFSPIQFGITVNCIVDANSLDYGRP